MINSFRNKHRFLSNFHPVPILFEGLWFSSVEHAYVAAKTTDETIRKQIQATEKPGDVKRLGRKIKLRDEWNDEFKLKVMEIFLRQKFSMEKEPYLAELLLETGEEELVEGNTWGDTFWGACKEKGENHLGKLLMKLRKELQENAANSQKTLG